jgi:hypothetical protein
VKPDVDTLPTVPDDPPAAGPDRALDPAPDLGPPAEPPPVAVVEVLLPAVVDAEVVVDEDEPQPASPITAHVNAAAMIRRLLLVDSNLVLSESFMMAFLLVPNAGCAGLRRRPLTSVPPRRARDRNELRRWRVRRRKPPTRRRPLQQSPRRNACLSSTSAITFVVCGHVLDVDLAPVRFHPEHA